MRERIRRLDKRPSTEVQQGTISSGITQVPQFQPVTQFSKGDRLAKTMGLLQDVVTTGFKIKQEYRTKQKNDAAKQLNAEKYQWLEELNELPSDSDRAAWIQNKVAEVSKPEVDEFYRDAVVASLDGKYSKYLKGAREESQIANGYSFSNRLIDNMMKKGKLEYETISAEFTDLQLPKAQRHKYVVDSLTSYLNWRTTDVESLEDLQALQKDSKALIAEYNKNPYLGGSKSANALDLQVKLNKALSSVTTSLNKGFKEQYQTSIAIDKRDLDVTPQVFKNKVEQAVKNGLQDESDSIKLIDDYSKAYVKQEDKNNFNKNFYVHSSSNNANYSLLSNDEKEIAKSHVHNHLESSFNNGFDWHFVETVVNNRELSKGFIKSVFSFNSTPTAIQQTQSKYNSIRTQPNGKLALSYMDKQSKAMYEILRIYPNAGVEDVQQFLITQSETSAPTFSFGRGSDAVKNGKRWNKVLASIPTEDKKVAEALRNYYFEFNPGDTKGAIEFVEDNYIPSVANEVSGILVNGKLSEEEAEKLTDMAQFVLGDYEFDSLHKSDDGTLTIYNKENPMFRAKTTQKQLEQVQGQMLLKQQLDAKIEASELAQERKAAIKAFTNSMSNPYYDKSGGLIGEFYREHIKPLIPGAVKSWEEGGETREKLDEIWNGITSFFGPTEAQGSGLKDTSIITTHLNRLGVTDHKEAIQNLNTFAELTGKVENSGKTYGRNKVSSASGLYQFLTTNRGKAGDKKTSLEVAIDRTARRIGRKPWMDKAYKSGKVEDLTREQQTIIFFGDLFEKAGSDSLMKAVLTGDRNAMLKAYYKLHHTNPDEQTKKVAEKYFLKK